MLIEIKNFNISIFKFIYLRKIIIILFRLKILIKIYYSSILKRDYIFNFKNLFYFILLFIFILLTFLLKLLFYVIISIK